jgi:uncharacterized protein YjbI with pentapeptide repeats
MRARRTAGAVALVAAALLAGALVRQHDRGEDHGRRCTDGRAPDLAGRTVTAIDLDGRPMRCVNLERSTVDGPVGAANLSGANLHRATLRDSALTDVDLSGADLTLSNAHAAEFTAVLLVKADLGGADLRGSTLTDVGLQHAHLKDANLHAASFVRADLRGADVRGADLSGATLTDSNLRGARLDGTNLDGTSWVNVVCPDGVKSTGGSCAGHV